MEFVYSRAQVVDHKLYGSRAEFDGTIDRVLEEFGVELVCLAGFMRILTGTFVKKWNGVEKDLGMKLVYIGGVCLLF